MKFRTVRDLLSEKELEAIQVAPLIATGRFPTWYPIFNSEPRPVDYLSNRAVAAISSKGDDDWLCRLGPRLHQMDDPEEAAASLAELRAYGAVGLAWSCGVHNSTGACHCTTACISRASQNVQKRQRSARALSRPRIARPSRVKNPDGFGTSAAASRWSRAFTAAITSGAMEAAQRTRLSSIQ